MTPDQWSRIEALYLAVVDLTTAERVELLNRATPDVRAEVEAMLAAPAKSNLLSHTAWGSVTKPVEPLLAPGVQIGQYRIEAKIGAGGMGMVFRALDTRLQRPVAIKVLSDDLADAAAHRRFQREAQAASSLNHPHILTVYDAGEFEGRQYLVTEFISGGTLLDWVRREPRSWEEITELLAGVADALATSHDAGILHRDIKPDNILITPSGYAKLVDFGLAKLEDSQAKTLTALTAARTIVGTIAYMSPEQASGKALDARSDMFSFAVVLYEMLAGHRPFEARGNLELIQRVIEATPAPLDASIPEPLRALVMKALEKNPADRFASMRELVIALRRAQRPSAQNIAAPPRGRTWLTAAGIAALVIAVAGMAFVFRGRRASPAPRLEYVPLTSFTDSAVAPALSPDGRMLAFIRGSSTFKGRGDVYIKLVPNGDPVQLTHDGGTKMGPISFSPDGSRVAYTGGVWEVWSVPVLGGEPGRMLADAEGLSWTGAQPSQILYSVKTGPGVHMGIFTATESRGGQRTVYMPASDNGMAHRSFLSPARDAVIVVEMNADSWLPCRLVPFSGDSKGNRVGPQPSQCTDAAWAPDGKFMYFSANTGDGFHIWRQRYPNGMPEQVTFGATEEQGISFAPDGKSFVTSVGERQSILWVHDAAGEHQITFEGYAYLPSFSGDAGQLYYLQRSNPTGRFVSGELWMTDLHSGKKHHLLPGLLMENYSISPDGKQAIYITAEKQRESPLWIAPTDGGSPPRRLVDQYCERAIFAPDGEIYFVGGEPETMFLQKIKPDGSGLQKMSPEPALSVYDISPDGKWVSAWVGSDIRIFPSAGGDPRVICTHCGAAGAEERGVTPPMLSWSRDGRELYLFSEDSAETSAVPLKPGEPLPAMPASGISFYHAPPTLAGMRIIPHQRAFMSGNPAIYAYAQVTAHRNIYRVPVP
ncbi:MAG TPA: protein kinase [Bryobacteraceae bacterium]|nr:protein kinase [Bryobacteraceae bacterium]